MRVSASGDQPVEHGEAVRAPADLRAVGAAADSSVTALRLRFAATRSRL
jgi:hypothetical protein